MVKVFKVLVVAAVVMIAGFFFGCDAKDANGISLTKYVPASYIDVSINGADNWSENIKELVVGQTYYVRVTIAIKSEKAGDSVQWFVSIPNTDVVEITLVDADGKTTEMPVNDVVTGTRRYGFNAAAFKDEPRPATVVFKCNPIIPGIIRIEISYDEQKVSDTYWKTRGLVYIEKSANEKPNQ